MVSQKGDKQQVINIKSQDYKEMACVITVADDFSKP